jgi:uncharacterized protein YbjT (DUF2867 family)
VRDGVEDIESLRSVLDGQDVAFCLAHSLAHVDFAERDRAGARAFVDAAGAAGVSQIVYLGGLDQPIALADAVRFLVGVAGLDAAIGETDGATAHADRDRPQAVGPPPPR